MRLFFECRDDLLLETRKDVAKKYVPDQLPYNLPCACLRVLSDSEISASLGLPFIPVNLSEAASVVLPLRALKGLGSPLTEVLQGKFPVDQFVEQCVNIVGAAILIVQVIGMLPHINR